MALSDFDLKSLRDDAGFWVGIYVGSSCKSLLKHGIPGGMRLLGGVGFLHNVLLTFQLKQKSSCGQIIASR